MVIAELNGADFASCMLQKCAWRIKFPRQGHQSDKAIAETYKSLFTFRDELIVDRNAIKVSTESTSAIDIIAVQLHLKHKKTQKQNLATLTTIVIFESK